MGSRDANSGGPNANEGPFMKQRKQKKKNRKNKERDDVKDANQNDEGRPLRLSIFYTCLRSDPHAPEQVFSEYGKLAYIQPFVTASVDDTNKGLTGFATFMDEETATRLIEEGKIRYGDDRYIKVQAFTPSKGSWYYKRLIAKEEDISKIPQLEEQFDTVCKDIGRDIQVTSKLTDGDVITTPGTEIKWELKITNKKPLAKVFYRIICSHPHLIILDNIPRDIKNRKPHPGFELHGYKTHTADIIYNPRELYGAQKFDIWIEGRGWTQHHQLKVQVIKEKEAVFLSLPPTSNFENIGGYGLYDGFTRTVISLGRAVSWLPSNKAVQWLRELKPQLVPNSVHQAVKNKECIKDMVPWSKKENHQMKLRQSLWMEESQMELDLRRFDIANAKLEVVKEYVARGITYFPQNDSPIAKLEASNIAERRPSVMAGDVVYAWIPGSKDYEYEGSVISTDQKHAYLAFNVELHKMLEGPHPITTWNIRFGMKPNDKFRFRRMYSAVDNMNLSVTWPERAVPPMKDEEIENYFDEAVKNDPYQSKVVKGIYKRRRTSKTSTLPPILLFGAFGTGKTRTLVEVICQIISHSPANFQPKILVCAVTNNAVDLMMESLIDSKIMTPDTLFRLYPSSRKVDSVQEVFLEYSHWNEKSKSFDFPSLETLRRYKVILTTAEKSHDLYSIGMNKGEFTHIFLDEAAQMLETEALIPLILADDKCIVVMSGDTKQLGPTIHNRYAKQQLSKSIMERLSELPGIYSEENNTKFELRMNYRSNRNLCNLNSTLFYDNKLVSRHDDTQFNDVYKITQWQKLRGNKNYVLENVKGRDRQKDDSPSFYNSEEALRTVDLIQDLINYTRENAEELSQEEIAVITPYEKQVQMFRVLLRSRKLRKVTVLNIDSTPGKEFTVVFLSTVRASDKWEVYDKEHDLGVIVNKKRMCTALTRAKECLIIVGDAETLIRDEKWKKLIEVAEEQGTYVSPIEEQKISYCVEEIKDNVVEEQKNQTLKLSSDKTVNGVKSVAVEETKPKGKKENKKKKKKIEQEKKKMQMNEICTTSQEEVAQIPSKSVEVEVGKKSCVIMDVEKPTKNEKNGFERLNNDLKVVVDHEDNNNKNKNRSDGDLISNVVDKPSHQSSTSTNGLYTSNVNNQNNNISNNINNNSDDNNRGSVRAPESTFNNHNSGHNYSHNNLNHNHNADNNQLNLNLNTGVPNYRMNTSNYNNFNNQYHDNNNSNTNFNNNHFNYNNNNHFNHNNNHSNINGFNPNGGFRSNVFQQPNQQNYMVSNSYQQPIQVRTIFNHQGCRVDMEEGCYVPVHVLRKDNGIEIQICCVGMRSTYVEMGDKEYSVTLEPRPMDNVLFSNLHRTRLWLDLRGLGNVNINTMQSSEALKFLTQ
eukprot:TRINITY_DN107_c0_g1_i1.p1 TRINITY_DN107_c0_g1~~TRINITY_DN107_c0_g1_i1.p1  ORF type:complete len:1380 (+),score=327.14 TRINITY_DN107_c0_g1_i1:105-4244(+)